MFITRNLNLICVQSWTYLCGRGAVVGGHKFRFRKLSIEVPVFHIVYFHIRELELLFTVPLCLNRASPSYNSHFL